MDFDFTAEQEKLRKEVRDFYFKEVPEDQSSHVAALSEGLHSFGMGLQKKAAAKGYITAGWPKEYGGLGLSGIAHGIVEEEEAYAGIASWPNNTGYSLAGPATILFGTDEQKKRYIPPITRGEVVWWQAFTEPDAGSDEANMALRAEKDGDDYILNGQKTFISGQYKPDFLYTEARTENTIPKHRGLSLFLIPGDTPGITYRPQVTMGFGVQNEIFFDDVRISRQCLLGEINKGFYHAMATFEFERSGTGVAARAKRNLHEFVDFCKEEKRNGKPLIEDPEVRKALAQMAVEIEIWRLAGWRTQWRFSEREKLGPLDFDLTGFFYKTLARPHTDTMMKILGAYGQLRKGSKGAKLAGWVENMWQKMRSQHAAGTVEILKVILAQRGLGLPRAPRPSTIEAGKNR